MKEGKAKESWYYNPLKTEEHFWTPEMGEVTNIYSPSGATEEVECRAMIQAALLWFKEEQEEPEFRVFRGFYGTRTEPKNEVAEEMRKAMMEAEMEVPKGVSHYAAGRNVRIGSGVMESIPGIIDSALHRATIQTMFIIEHGWEKYKEKMKKGAPIV